MIGKDEEYMESQTKINLSEIYNNEEIKLLKKSIPDISNMIILASNNEFNNTNITKITNDRINPNQYRYLSPLRKLKNNSNTSFLIDKEKFYVLILDTAKNFFEKEQNLLLSKSISLIMDEIINISKIIKQNLIYNKFFKSIKNTKLLSYSTNKDKLTKNIKYKNNSVIKKNNSKNKVTLNRNTVTNENLKILKSQKENDINNNSTVKKQLSFKTDGETKKNNKKEYSKSVCEINLLQKDKEKSNISNINSFLKKDSSINSKNKMKSNSNASNTNKKNYKRNNINSMNNSSSQIKANKKSNNIFLIGNCKISLKKAHYDRKKIGIYDLINNKNEYNLTSNNQINKKNLKNKESEISQKNNKKIVSSPSTINSDLYKNIETQEFNIFTLEKNIGREMVLPLIGYYIFNCFEFGEIIKYNKFEKWCQKISDGYLRKNYYHNDLHAADVTQTCMLYFKYGEIDKIQKFSKPDKCALILSCISHDYRHPGVNNNFLKETNNKLAIRYNDVSILENMHISSTFKLISTNEECNIFENVEKNLYKEMRKQMIACVLATDMAFHNIYVDFLKNCIQEKNDEKKEEKKEDKKIIEEKHQKFLNLFIHSSDISNPTKLFDIYFEWAKLVVEEFWDQGDKEKQLNLPCFCDREKVSIYQSQLGFINFIEIPYFSLFGELDTKLKFFYDNLLNNKNILLSMQEKEKEKEGKKQKAEKLLK